jgi:hypothetical protein
MTHRAKVFVVVLLSIATLGLLSGFSGCQKSFISDVSFTVEPNIETATLLLNFAKDVQSDLGGSFPVKNYGTLELNPSTTTSPFSVGFRLNTNIFNDQEYVRLQPTLDLPNGQPIPALVNRALAQVKLKNQINPNFDIYTYVDVVGREWLGVAVTLKYTNSIFPGGLAVSQNFLKDSKGNARAVAAIFGPKLDGNGNIAVPGGIALFANVRALIDDAKSSVKKSATPQNVYAGASKPVSQAQFYGPLGAHYNANPKDAAFAIQAFKAALKNNMRAKRLP